jgi:putative phage-type endonuclease
VALTLEQKKIRMSGIGGSDVAAILGVSKWKTSLEVYLDKIYEPTEDINVSDAIYWGNRLEPLIIDEFQVRTGKKCAIEPNTLRHPQYEFMLANLDARIVGENAILECKTAGQFMAKNWSKDGGENLPEEYMLQVAHYCAVANTDIAYVAVLIGGRDYRMYHYKRNLKLEEAMIKAEYNFWHNHVLKQIPPHTDIKAA